MAQVKVINSKRPPKQPKSGLDELPEVKQTDRQPKSLTASNKEKSRTRAGKIKMGPSPYEKLKVVERGLKIK